MFGLIGMLWKREDFIGHSFPPEVCSKIAQGMEIISKLGTSRVIKGMSPPEFSVMCCASDYPENHSGKIAAVADIASEMGVSVPAVSRTLRTLQQKGWIERQADENDRRTVRVTVTEAGMAVLKENLDHITHGMNAVMSAFTYDEICTIADLYSKFAAAVGKHIEENPES